MIRSNTCTLAKSRWRSLGASRAELVLENTLPTGQSFRWQKTAEDVFTGVIGERVVQLKQLEEDVQWRVIGRGPSAPSDYLNLDINLGDLTKEWASRDSRYDYVNRRLTGCRLMRQDPVECLFQFICSSNNHISRIHSMVNHLSVTYGTKLPWESDAAREHDSDHMKEWYAFPTIDQLQQVSEEDLRANGFGYRAAYISKTAKQLREIAPDGRAWLLQLREEPFDVTIEKLTQFPGVGPKVAACVALFSCDKFSAIPVDTHVWRLACAHYLPTMRGKTLTAKLHPLVMQAFVDRFGEYAGWAHNALFISQLASHKHLFKEQLDGKGETAAIKEGSRRGGKKVGKRDHDPELGAGDDKPSKRCKMRVTREAQDES